MQSPISRTEGGSGMRLKTKFAAFGTFTLLFSAFFVHGQEAIIADHTVTGIRRIEHIPLEWIQKARDSLKIAYQHTSHGRQIDDQGLAGVALEYGEQYAVNKSSTDDGSGIFFISPAMRHFGGPNDLGRGDNNWWVSSRSMLDNHPEINVIMWSFCGGASSASEEAIATYLEEGDKIENDYPGVRMVFITGHTDGRGPESTLHRNNEAIRKFCRENNKILFDFADIESYAPDGRDMMALYCNDECEYDKTGNNSPNDRDDGNWADEWCDAQPNDCYYSGGCAHSQSLNCQLKGEAAWWMFARMVGWEGFGGTAAEKAERNALPNGIGKIKARGYAPVVIYDIRGRILAACKGHEIDAVLSRVGSHAAMIIHSAEGKRMHMMHPMH